MAVLQVIDSTDTTHNYRDKQIVGHTDDAYGNERTKDSQVDSWYTKNVFSQEGSAVLSDTVNPNQPGGGSGIDNTATALAFDNNANSFTTPTDYLDAVKEDNEFVGTDVKMEQLTNGLVQKVVTQGKAADAPIAISYTKEDGKTAPDASNFAPITGNPFKYPELPEDDTKAHYYLVTTLQAVKDNQTIVYEAKEGKKVYTFKKTGDFLSLTTPVDFGTYATQHIRSVWSFNGIVDNNVDVSKGQKYVINIPVVASPTTK